ncbi:MAG: phosphotransferase [Alphaproteobacteria bacterium]|nr:phosphotransferase [Alphaproteobacteria bacterium]
MTSSSVQLDQDGFWPFLESAGWGSADMTPLGTDMGLRRYYRLMTGEGTALLMDMSRAGILENGLESYIRVADFFRECGIQTPHIYAYDVEQGLAVIEDFGDISFGTARRDGTSSEEIYQKATDILIQLRQSAQTNSLGLKLYEEMAIRKRLAQFVEYYMPVAAGRATTKADQVEFQNILAEIEKTLPPCPMGVCHADFHLENLMWCPEHKGHKSDGHRGEGYGVIDFQDSFWGPLPYDLLNCLEDARQSVPEDIKEQMKARYCEGMGVLEKQAFDAWYVYMSAHFHCRVIGLFIKFAREGRGREFLTHIPRLQGYLKKNLQNPILAPLKEFMDRHKVSFDIDVSKNI